MNSLLELVPDGLEPYAIPAVSLILASLLFIAAPKILAWRSQGENHVIQVNVLRAVILAFVALQIADLVLNRALADDYDRLMYKAGGTLIVTFGAIVSFNLLSRILNRKLGFVKVMDGQTYSVASYQSWLSNLILGAVLFVFALLAVIQIWEFTSLTERTGLIGIIAAFIILTSSVWFPDVFHGILMQRSQMAEEGDTIIIADDDSLYIVHRLTPFYCLLLNINTNARVVVKNSNMLKGPIENLTKRAAVDGLRRSVELKLSYPAGNNTDTDQRRHSVFSDFDKAVSAAFERLEEQPELQINNNKPFSWLLSDTGDYALHFCVYFHLKPVPVTKLTQKIRDHLNRTPAGVVRLLYEEFEARDLHLATPILINTFSGNSSGKTP